MYPLVLGKILGAVLKTLTGDGKYPVQGCENLQLRIQMQLSPKQKGFLYFLLHFWNLHQIFHILEKKVIPIANVLLKLETVKILVRPLSKKHRFRTGFHSEHVKASQILPKSP